MEASAISVNFNLKMIKFYTYPIRKDYYDRWYQPTAVSQLLLFQIRTILCVYQEWN